MELLSHMGGYYQKWNCRHTWLYYQKWKYYHIITGLLPHMESLACHPWSIHQYHPCYHHTGTLEAVRWQGQPSRRWLPRASPRQRATERVFLRSPSSWRMAGPTTPPTLLLLRRKPERQVRVVGASMGYAYSTTFSEQSYITSNTTGCTLSSRGIHFRNLDGGILFLYMFKPRILFRNPQWVYMKHQWMNIWQISQWLDTAVLLSPKDLLLPNNIFRPTCMQSVWEARWMTQVMILMARHSRARYPYHVCVVCDYNSQVWSTSWFSVFTIQVDNLGHSYDSQVWSTCWFSVFTIQVDNLDHVIMMARHQHIGCRRLI